MLSYINMLFVTLVFVLEEKKCLALAGKFLEPHYETEVVIKRNFTVFLVSILGHKVNIKIAQDVDPPLTRKLTKLAPKLIKGLWFLKQDKDG